MSKYNVFIGLTKQEIIDDSDDDNQILYCFGNDESFKNLKDKIKLHFIIILFKGNLTLTKMKEKISNDWSIDFDETIDLKFLTNKKVHLRKNIKNTFRDIEYNSVCYKLPMIGFDAGDMVGEYGAYDIIRKSIIKSVFRFNYSKMFQNG